MRQLGHDIHRAIAALLLTTFVVGGLLAPALHRAQHGMLEARLKAEAADACDHALHGLGYETTLPDALDDDCLFCVRPLHFDGQQAHLIASQGAAVLTLPSRPAPDTSVPALLSIRGPPRAA